jgi:(p)ppGpp synthase/HD superfamily hydrolase
MGKLDTAVSFAVQVHSGQVRKGSNLPYVVHPVEVTKRLSDMGVTDEVTLIAAVLHDTLEDSPKNKLDATKKYIWDTFGDDVLQVVEELTFTPGEGTKEAYVAGFVEKRPESIAVKVVDRCCNILDLRTAKDFKKAVAYTQQGRPLYQLLTLGVYRETGLRLITKYCEVTVTELTLFAKHVWEQS